MVGQWLVVGIVCEYYDLYGCRTEMQRTPHDQDGRLLHLSYLPFFVSVTQKSFLKQVPLGGAAPLLFHKKMLSCAAHGKPSLLGIK